MSDVGVHEDRIAREHAALLFRVGAESFAAPLAEVEEAVDHVDRLQYDFEPDGIGSAAAVAVSSGP